ncbi:hypothetical protein M422DRAFT_255364, partial [Sphaerobolus stellatus SS14]
MSASNFKIGSLVLVVLFIPVTIFQLALAIRWQYRSATKHYLPGISAIIAQALLLLDYVFLLVSFFEGNTPWGEPFTATSRGLGIVESLCSLWADPFVFLTIAIVLADRYLAYSPPWSKNAVQKPLPISIILTIFAFLAFA